MSEEAMTDTSIKAQHTPTPWAVDERGDRPLLFNTTYDIYVATIMKSVVGPEIAVANAHFILRAVNNHAALVEALQLLRDHQNGCPLPKYQEGWDDAMAKADAALAAAEDVT